MDLYKFSVILECTANAAGFEATLDAIKAMSGLAEPPELVLIFRQKKYALEPALLKKVQSLKETGVACFWTEKNSKLMPSACLEGLKGDIAFFLRAGDVPEPASFKYIDCFFKEHHKTCAVVFLPLTNGALPPSFASLPRGGISEPGADFPRSARGGALWLPYTRDTAFDNNCADNAAFAAVLEDIARRQRLYGRINKVTVSAMGALQQANSAMRFPVSCIIPVYNVGHYLEEAIDSIIGQTLDFEENVQLVLVNDGSTDYSGDICKKYLQRYPYNVTYIEQENRGVSAARNAGLNAACGDYIAFLDGDDLADSRYLEAGIEFLTLHEDEVDFVAFPLELFGNVRDGAVHPLDFKFIETKVVDIDKEPKYLQMHVASTLIKRTAIGTSRFSEELSYGEDTDFLHRLLLSNPRYGVSTESCLHYRKRDGSALAESTESAGWYDKLRLMSARLTAQSLEVRGEIIPYTQECIMYDLQWYAFESSELDLSGAKEALIRALDYLDDTVIAGSKRLSRGQKLHLLSLKNGKPRLYCDENGIWLRFPGGFTDRVQPELSLHIIEEYNGIVRISGSMPYEYGVSVSALYNESFYEPGKKTYRDNEYFLAEKVCHSCYFDFDIPFENDGAIEFFVQIDGVGTFPAFPVYEPVCGLNGRKRTFLFGESVIISRTDTPNRLWAEKLSAYKVELLFDNLLGNQTDGFLRKYQKMYPLMSKRRIWLFMDREKKADDNAEHLFRYCAAQNDGIEKFFVISEDSPDYERMKDYGNVLAFGSDEHKLLHMFAEKYISSNFDDMYRFPFGNDKESKLLKNMCRAQYVFLQHGVIKDDMSPVLNRWKRNMKLFVTTGRPEYDSIINGDYGYDASVVKLTGLPRHDNLSSNSTKTVVFAPTWRKDLTVGPARNVYNNDFAKTPYWQAVSELLNDSAFIDDLCDMGYALQFRPHPVVYNQEADFSFDKRVKIVPNETSYMETLSKAALLVTDYSSLAFDFAYLEKPVIYYHFDGGNWKKGYFDYDTMGFGEIADSHDNLKKLVLKSLRNGAKMLKKYSSRAEKFFAFRDKENCRRVYEAIL